MFRAGCMTRAFGEVMATTTRSPTTDVDPVGDNDAAAAAPADAPLVSCSCTSATPTDRSVDDKNGCFYIGQRLLALSGL